MGNAQTNIQRDDSVAQELVGFLDPYVLHQYFEYMPVLRLGKLRHVDKLLLPEEEESGEALPLRVEQYFAKDTWPAPAAPVFTVKCGKEMWIAAVKLATGVMLARMRVAQLKLDEALPNVQPLKNLQSRKTSNSTTRMIHADKHIPKDWTRFVGLFDLLHASKNGNGSTRLVGVGNDAVGFTPVMLQSAVTPIYAVLPTCAVTLQQKTAAARHELFGAPSVIAMFVAEGVNPSTWQIELAPVRDVCRALHPNLLRELVYRGTLIGKKPDYFAHGSPICPPGQVSTTHLPFRGMCAAATLQQRRFPLTIHRAVDGLGSFPLRTAYADVVKRWSEDETGHALAFCTLLLLEAIAHHRVSPRAHWVITARKHAEPMTWRYAVEDGDGYRSFRVGPTMWSPVFTPGAIATGQDAHETVDRPTQAQVLEDIERQLQEQGCRAFAVLLWTARNHLHSENGLGDQVASLLEDLRSRDLGDWLLHTLHHPSRKSIQSRPPVPSGLRATSGPGSNAHGGVSLTQWFADLHAVGDRELGAPQRVSMDPEVGDFEVHIPLHEPPEGGDDDAAFNHHDGTTFSARDYDTAAALLQAVHDIAVIRS